MKKIIAVVAFALLAQTALACVKGCTDYQGTCACDAPSEQAGPVHNEPTTDPSIVSNEAPRKGVQPAWETGEVHADILGGGAKVEVSAATKSEDMSGALPNGGVPAR